LKAQNSFWGEPALFEKQIREVIVGLGPDQSKFKSGFDTEMLVRDVLEFSLMQLEMAEMDGRPTQTIHREEHVARYVFGCAEIR